MKLEIVESKMAAVLTNADKYLTNRTPEPSRQVKRFTPVFVRLMHTHGSYGIATKTNGAELSDDLSCT